MTKDFSTTIQHEYSPNVCDYLRPAHWIISSPYRGDTIFVLSLYEVNDLLPEIRKSCAVHLHQYSLRVTQTTKSENLRFYCIPALPPQWVPPTSELVSQLNLWAGQLYLEDYKTYLRLCEFLGVYTRIAGSGDATLIQSDGFIKPSDRQGAMKAL